MEQFLWQAALGIVIGTVGTLIGVGGGFILVPVLLFLYPSMPPQVVTAISLAVICANATSGSIAYARQRRINYKAGILFALAGIPGSVLGVIILRYVSADFYRILFGSFLAVLAVYLFARPAKKTPQQVSEELMPESYNLKLGMALSFIVGFMSSILGIGGGLIHVPVMVYILHFPVHFATATSHFVLAIITAASTIVHILQGHLTGQWILTLSIIAGVIPGAQLGAYLSQKLKSVWLIRALAVALAMAAARIIFMG